MSTLRAPDRKYDRPLRASDANPAQGAALGSFSRIEMYCLPDWHRRIDKLEAGKKAHGERQWLVDSRRSSDFPSARRRTHLKVAIATGWGFRGNIVMQVRWWLDVRMPGPACQDHPPMTPRSDVSLAGL